MLVGLSIKVTTTMSKYIDTIGCAAIAGSLNDIDLRNALTTLSNSSVASRFSAPECSEVVPEIWTGC